MQTYIKKKLEERNAKLIKAIIKKAEKVCPGSIALIGIVGSFHTGDIYEKSDLDLCIVINDDNGWKVSTCFILDDVAFDIYCTPWSSLEKMSEYHDPYIAKLVELDIVYSNDEKYIQKYMELRTKVISRLQGEYSKEDNEKAERFVDEVSKAYVDILLSDKYGECRYAVSRMIYNIEFAIYMYNKAYITRGVKRIPEEITKMKYLPEDFSELYWELIKAQSIEEMKNISTILMKAIKNFAREMKSRVIVKKEICEADIVGSYEEIYSNWKNKMYHAADKNDSYLSLMTAANCQQFYDEMYGEYNIDRIDIMDNIISNDLISWAKAFDYAMEEYKKNYEKLGVKIEYYKDLDEFEEIYLG